VWAYENKTLERSNHWRSYKKTLLCRQKVCTSYIPTCI